MTPAAQETKELKRKMRREARERRAALEPAWRAEASNAIRRLIMDLPEMARAKSIALISSVGDEINTHPLIAALMRLKGSVLLPRCLMAERRLEFLRVRDFRQGFVAAYQGIREPHPDFHP